MLKHTYLSIIVLAAFLLSANLNAQVDVPAAPENLEGELQIKESYPEQYVAWLEWDYELEFDKNEITLDSYMFVIYMAPEKTTDLEKFSEVAWLHPLEAKGYNDWDGKFNFMHRIFDKGTYSYYVTMWKFSEVPNGGEVESKPSNIIHINAEDITEYPNVWFTTDINEYEYEVGETIYIDFNADTDAEVDVPIKFDLMHKDLPEDHKFDENTGEFEFTPSLPGFYFIEVRAYLDGVPSRDAYMHAEMYVKEKSCAVIQGKLVPDKDIMMDKSSIAAYKIYEDANSGYVKSNVYYSGVDPESGEFSIEVPEGKYALRAQGFGFLSTNAWYNNKANFLDADKIDISCGETEDITFEIEVKEPPQLVELKGKVVSKETGDPVQSHLMFVPAALVMDDEVYEDFGDYFIELLTDTDSNGEFSVKLYDAFEYIAMALPHEGNYEPQFYNATLDIFAAKRISVSDYANEEFVFELITPEVFENSISGSVSNEAGEIIESKVVAYMVEPTSSGDNGVEFTRSAIVGNSGNYRLNNLQPGKYVVLSAPGKHEYTPGYYTDSGELVTEWKDATKIEVLESGNIKGIDFVHDKAENGSIEKDGFAEVFGTVYKDESSVEKKNSDDNIAKFETTMAGVMVFLKDENGNIIDQSITNNNGEFEIGELEPGNYKLEGEKAGYTSNTVSLTADYDLNFRTQYTLIMTKKSITSVDEEVSSLNGVSAFPSPANTSTTISATGITGSYTLKVFDANGNEVLSKTGNASGVLDYDLNTAAYANGAYFIRLSNAGNEYTGNFTVVK